jgi:phosphate transport system substrate-binding protein
MFVRRVIALGVILATGTTVAAAAAVRLTETGSTLIYPIMTVWIDRYRQSHGDFQMDAAATGSGVGIRSTIEGTVQLGASDAYLTDAEMKPNGLLNIPLAVSAQEVDYNVPEMHGQPTLKMSGAVLAAIYSGAVGYWDDKRITELNPGARLPHRQIIPVRRSEGSGDTFLFTQYLSLSSPAWDKGPHFGTTVKWPDNGAIQDATGNAGVIDTCQRVTYCIAYVGSSYSDRARASGLEPFALQNKSGAYIRPSTEAVLATADALSSSLGEDGRLSMVYQTGGEAYPLVNFEYAIVRQQQTTPGVATELKEFLNWIVAPNAGNDEKLLAPVHFVPLPEHARSVARKLIASINGP